MLKKALCLAAFAATLLPALVAQTAMTAAAPAQITVERGVEMKTRDGVTLRADIYRPTADGRYPTLLQRKIGRASCRERV